MDRLEEYLLAAENSVGKEQRGAIKRKRAGEALTREQVKAIKKGRKALKAEMKERGLKTKQDFELMATSMGLYFDKSALLAFLPWLFKGKGLWLLLGATAVAAAALFGLSLVTQMKGYFTINMSDKMFREGFVLSDSVGFENPTTQLFCTPAQNVPCISITQIPENVDSIDGQHNENYFAYTFYVRNEGESTVGYDWTARINSESLDLSKAVWVMIFEDGEMTFYAEPTQDGMPQALPDFEDNSRGFLDPVLMRFCADPEQQYQLIANGSENGYSYYRIVPQNFVSEDTVAQGTQTDVAPQEVHKYTVVIWLEGDDPDCTNDLIGGHLGMDFNFRLTTEEADADADGGIWDDLKFWE